MVPFLWTSLPFSIYTVCLQFGEGASFPLPTEFGERNGPAYPRINVTQPTSEDVIRAIVVFFFVFLVFLCI